MTKASPEHGMYETDAEGKGSNRTQVATKIANASPATWCSDGDFLEMTWDPLNSMKEWVGASGNMLPGVLGPQRARASLSWEPWTSQDPCQLCIYHWAPKGRCTGVRESDFMNMFIWHKESKKRWGGRMLRYQFVFLGSPAFLYINLNHLEIGWGARQLVLLGSTWLIFLSSQTMCRYACPWPSLYK